MTTRTVALALLAYVPMLAEAAVSRRHERALRAMGAFEPADDVYRTMQAVYPACFLAILLEHWLRGAPEVATAGAVVFLLAKALKYWAIVSLGQRWSFRVLVLRGAPLVARGPYRWLRHPNYVGVAGELAGMALMARAPIGGTIAVVGFVALMFARIRVEERALGIARPT